MKNVTTITLNPAVDKNASVTHVIAERKLRCSTPVFEPGGGGINVSRAIKKLGGHSTAVYLAGGPTGDILEKLLDEEGIQQSRIALQEWTRENLIVSEEATGLQYRFGMPGPSVNLCEWQKMLDHVSHLDPSPDYIVASGSIPPGVPEDIYARLAHCARKKGARLVVDTSGVALREGIKAGIFLLKPNIGELASLEGKAIEDDTHLEAAARNLIDSGQCEHVVVSLGAGGALLVTSNLCMRITAPTVAIQSKVGAGDSMVAGLVLALARGSSIQDSVLYGVAAGSAAVMTPGTQLCNQSDTLRLFEQLMNRPDRKVGP